jgi:predicted ATP-grasp superfamily ATP-dependent carboligase
MDEKDGNFKLIEINPRPGMWNYSVLKSGVNLPFMAYQEVIGYKKYNGVTESEDGKIWIFLYSDFINSLFLFKKNGYMEYHLSLLEWIKSIAGGKIFAIESSNDLFPCLFYYFSVIKSIISRGVKKLK